MQSRSQEKIQSKTKKKFTKLWKQYDQLDVLCLPVKEEVPSFRCMRELFNVEAMKLKIISVYYPVGSTTVDEICDTGFIDVGILCKRVTFMDLPFH